MPTNLPEAGVAKVCKSGNVAGTFTVTVVQGSVTVASPIDVPAGECRVVAEVLANTQPRGQVTITETSAGLQSVTLQTCTNSTPGGACSTLANPPFITDETTFAFVLSSPGTCAALAGPFNADPYPRGGGYYQGPPYPPGIWAPAGADLGFKTYVDAICQVPALVGGAGSDASGTLDRYGCALGSVTQAYSRDVLQGDVISQSQVEGTRLPAASKVDVVVSRGAPPCKVPNVRRMRLARAKATLTRALCRVGSVRKVRAVKAMKGRVIRQRPAPGTRLPEGSRVNLVVGRR